MKKEKKFAQIKQLLWHTVAAELLPANRAVQCTVCIVVFVIVKNVSYANAKKSNAGSKMNDAVCN